MSDPTNRRPAFRTVEEVAEEFRLSQRTIRRWIRNGELPVHRYGRRIRISDEDIVALRNNNRR